MLLWVLLRRHNAGIDLARARELAEVVSFAEINELFALGWPEPTFDPKARTTPMETDRGPVPA
jgi:hypothetical protein